MASKRSPAPERIQIASLDSPIGEVMVAVRGGRVCALTFADGWAKQRGALLKRLPNAEFVPAADPAGIIGRLAKYFRGQLDALDEVEVDTGGTPFQQRVWSALREIRPGRTSSYGELARAIGSSSAVRAVGAANGANPVSIIVPCHRVIGADGKLVGYGGGMDRKRWLLAHEHAIPVQLTTAGAARSAADAD